VADEGEQERFAEGRADEGETIMMIIEDMERT
jgi:hypothetical protein